MSDGAAVIGQSDQARCGCVRAKNAAVSSSRGGIHQGLATDAVTFYLTAVLGLVGIDEIGFIDAEGTDLQPQGKVKAMQSAMQQMKASLLKKMSLLLINC